MTPQGILDENYKGIFDPEFLDMVDSSEEEAREAYENSVGVEADFLIGSLMDNAPTEEQRQELIDLLQGDLLPRLLQRGLRHGD